MVFTSPLNKIDFKNNRKCLGRSTTPRRIVDRRVPRGARRGDVARRGEGGGEGVR